jgi:hypothetical protein
VRSDKSIEQSGAGGSSCALSATTNTIGADVEGARRLINNYVLSYRCAMAKAANGRQLFQLPAFAAAMAGVTAAALGASPEVAVLAGAAVSTANSGNSYYVPREKSGIFNKGLDALICIQMESVGVTSFSFENSLAGARAARHSLGDDEIELPLERQYFELVAGAAYSVERLMVLRLNNVGNFDSAGVIAQLEKLNDEIANARKPPQDDTPQGVTPADEALRTLVETARANPQLPANRALLERVVEDSFVKAMVRAERTARISLTELKPRLEQCVLRAKID